MSAYDPEPVDWIWRKWLPRDHMTLLSSRGGTGKGSIAIEMCLAAVGGLEEWPDGTPTPPIGEYTAILLSYEDLPRYKVATRIAAFGQHDNKLARDNILIHSDLRSISVFDAIDVLLAANNGPQVGLIVIDPLANVIGNEDIGENDNAAMTKLMQRFATYAEEQRVAILLVHHDRKSGVLDSGVLQDGARGASAIANSVRCYWALADDPGGDDHTLFLGKTKSNLGTMRGVIEYEMEHWEDRDDARIETGVLRHKDHYDDVTLQQKLRDRKNVKRDSNADVKAQQVLEYLRLPTTDKPISQRAVQDTFVDTDLRTMRAAFKVLETEGAIGKHPLTKNEAKEYGWDWKPKQYVISLLGAQND